MTVCLTVLDIGMLFVTEAVLACACANMDLIQLLSDQNIRAFCVCGPASEKKEKVERRK